MVGAVNDRTSFWTTLWICVALMWLPIERPNQAFALTPSIQELAELRNSVAGSYNSQSQQPQQTDRHQDDSNCNSSSSLSFSFDDDQEDDDTTFSELIGGMFVVGASSPFWAPRAAIGDDSLAPGYFLRYPYLHEHEGALTQFPQSPSLSRGWMLRARGEFADNFDDLSKIGGGLLLDTSSRWGIDSEFNYRQEDLFSGRDSLWTGNTNLVFRFAQSEKVQLRSGIGVNWLADHGQDDYGFNFTYGGDWFPAKPIVVSHEIDWGRLGDASLFHGRITTGIIYHRMEFYIGYDYLDVGDSELSGMVAGVRLWLSNRVRKRPN